MSEEKLPIPALSESVPARIVQSVLVMVDGRISLNDLCEARLLIDATKQFCRESEEQWRAAALAEVKANGPFYIGSVKYFEDVDKVVKCRDTRKTLEAILVASKGDQSAVEDCLSTSAFKPGKTRDLFAEKGMPELYEQCFEVKTVDKLGIEKPKKLQEIDTKFLK